MISKGGILGCTTSHVFLYLNGLNPCNGHLDIFWNIWNLVLWREAGNKRSSCSDNSKFGALIPGQSEQQFKIQSHFLIFDELIVEIKLYDGAESKAVEVLTLCLIYEWSRIILGYLESKRELLWRWMYNISSTQYCSQYGRALKVKRAVR